MAKLRNRRIEVLAAAIVANPEADSREAIAAAELTEAELELLDRRVEELERVKERQERNEFPLDEER